MTKANNEITYGHRYFLHRITLVTVLFAIVIYNYFGEHVPLCDGYGWDGCSYYKGIVLNGCNEYLSNSISYYHTHRMLPFLLNHYAMKLLSIPQTAQNVMMTSSIINILLLCLAVWFFFGISKSLKWKKPTEILAFSFAFFNFHVLKFMGYCPVMTDMPTFTLSWAAAYFFIKNKTGKLALIGILGMVTFPLLSLIILFLIALPKEEFRSDNNCFSQIVYISVKAIYMFWLPVAFTLYIVFRYMVRGIESFECVFIVRHPQNIYMAIAGIVAYVVFYYFATKSFKKDWKDFFGILSKPEAAIKIIILLIIFIVLYKLPTLHGFEGQFSLANELAQICQFPATDILIFIETPFLYLGIVFILFMFFWPKICDIGMQWGTGYFITLMLALFFLPDIETRKLICFFVFCLLPLIQYIDNSQKIRRRFVLLAVAFQLVLSFFWFTINVPGIKEAFDTYSVETYLQWPSQRYYMFQGPWQSHLVYFIVLTVEIMIIIALYICRKRKILYVGDNGKK